MNPLPSESISAAERAAWFAREARAARWLCWLSPLLGLVTVVLAWKYLLWVLYLQTPRSGLDFRGALTYKPGLLLGLIGFAMPFVWYASVLGSASASQREGKSRVIPFAAIIAVIGVGMIGAALEHPRVRWFFAEWAKVRTPNPSFARNMLYWEARDFEGAGPVDHPKRRVDAVGSSQMYFALRPEVLASALEDARVEKNCMAGLGPIQYLFLADRITENKPDVVVCWLSEFDFYREDHLPGNRLQWASSKEGIARLWQACRGMPRFRFDMVWEAVRHWRRWPEERGDLWSERSDLANLAFAASNPLWRHRDHFRRCATGYWWDLSRPAEATESSDMALSAGMDQAIENLRQNVGDKAMVPVNFAAFEQFSRLLQDRGIRLLVLEGSSHPEAMAAYDARYRIETRERLESIAERTGCEYRFASALPPLDANDFADPYHLNAEAAERITRSIAEAIDSMNQPLREQQP